MQKVINSHCHIYPDKIAAKAVKGIRDFYDLHMSLNGTVKDLIEDGNKVGAVHYLIHSVATTPKQVQSINEFISFEVKFQQFALNEEKAFKMGEAINERGLPIMIHCGDFRYNYSNPEHLKPFLERFPDLTVIGAHFAGWSMWEKATEELAGTPNLFVDCSSSLYALSPETAKDLIHAYGADKVLWATDFPMWESTSEMEMFNKIDLTEEERNLILYENAAKLLGLK